MFSFKNLHFKVSIAWVDPICFGLASLGINAQEIVVQNFDDNDNNSNQNIADIKGTSNGIGTTPLVRVKV
ncbi:MAG TPA: hypothetical protein VJR94_07655 [Candidatus Nitrosocosmicus sp.]|nr:hypothetical protein [Candidatus Nitrosocosmicus sp.]